MNENVDFVIKNKMCTGCGTCVSMCSRQAIIIDLDNNSGLYQPIIDSNLCNNCGICYNVCPAIEFDFDGIDSKIFGMKSNNSIVGNYINFYVGSSNNKELNQECSSGLRQSAIKTLCNIK
jgi:coenzyme F420 hydrogenase subunit beta